MAQFLLSCESTVDVPYAYMHSRGIPVIFYSCIVDEQAYPDDMGRDPEALPRFYAFLDAGKLPCARRNEHDENKKQETARDPKRIGTVSCLHAKQNGLL